MPDKPFVPMRVRYILLLLALGSALYLALWPVPGKFRAFAAEPAPALEGALSPNEGFAEMRRTGTVGAGPEDVAIDSVGALYTGIADGHIYVLEPGKEDWRPITLTYGRPLGLAFSPDERWLYVADGERGLMRTDRAGHLERLVDSLDGEDLGLVDDLAVMPDGTVYFTSASRRFAVDESVDAMLAHDRTGRLLHYDPHTRALSLLSDSLSFPNGVARSADGRWLYVAQTADYNVLRYPLDTAGRVVGVSEVWATNLPGFPDGVNVDDDGRAWVSLVNPRNALLDRLADRPALRKVVWRLPGQFRPKPVAFGMIVRLSEVGQIDAVLGGQTGQEAKFRSITNAVWHRDKLYLGSLDERSVGIVDVR